MNAEEILGKHPFETAFPAELRLAKIREELPYQLKTMARLCGNAQKTFAGIDGATPVVRDHLKVAVEHQLNALEEMISELQTFFEVEIQ